jgi:hypothetical protein
VFLPKGDKIVSRSCLHEGVVVGDHDDLVDSLGLEGILLLDEGGNVLLGAGGGEGAGDGNQDDLLLLEFCEGVSIS